MASCDPFSVDFKGDAQDLLDKLSKLIHGHGGQISGDATRGTVSINIPVVGKFEGSYAVSHQTCTIHITERPFLVPCGTIEKFVRDNIPTIEKELITNL